MGDIASCCVGTSRGDYIDDEKRQLLNKRKTKLSVSVLTWNVAAKPPNDSISKLFKHRNFNADIVVIGLQEVIELNATVSATSLVMDVNQSEDALWEEKIYTILNHKDKNKYKHVKSMDLVGILLLVFVRRSLDKSIHNVASGKCAAGFLGIGGNKGAVSIRFDVLDTRICFICCHLAAHKKEVAARNENYHKIINELKFTNVQSLIPVADEKQFMDETLLLHLDHDVVFMFGDLNYRLNYDASELEDVYDLIQKRKWDELLSNDQLLNAMKNEEAFDGFTEHKIKFQPTYKFEPGTNKYEQEKKRIPSYCDRILWRTNDAEKQVSCCKYDAFLSQKMSDHKPVIGLYQFDL